MSPSTTRDSTGSNNTTDDKIVDSKTPATSSENIAIQISSADQKGPKVAVPLSVQSLITQTDKSGLQVRLAAPIYEKNEAQSASNLNEEIYPSSSKIPFFQRLFCCGRRALSKQYNAYKLNDDGVLGALGTDKGGVKNKLQQYGPIRGPPQRLPVMSPPPPMGTGKKCLALDLDETLVHSSFQPVDCANYVIPVTIDNVVHNVFVIKRPGVDEFMRRLGEEFEIVVYTASLSKYADPLLDELDIHKVISKRLFRENCVFHEGHYVKDLSLLNRDLSQTIIVDNSPMSYIFHPENAIDCGSFIDDLQDIELWQLADFLLDIKSCDDVRSHCRHWREWCRSNPSTIPDIDDR